MIDVLLTLLILQGPDGHEIHLNPESITSMRAAVKGRDNEHLRMGINCLINTTDGKFISVKETCEAVQLLIEGGKKR